MNAVRRGLKIKDCCSVSCIAASKKTEQEAILLMVMCNAGRQGATMADLTVNDFDNVYQKVREILQSRTTT